jgi:hypothetical protein
MRIVKATPANKKIGPRIIKSCTSYSFPAIIKAIPSPTRQTPITVKHITVYLLELGFPLYLLKFFTGVTVALSENIVS